MKTLFKPFLTLLLLIVITANVHAQLTGTYTIPGDYATIAAAVADLNAQGVGGVGVSFNVTAGYTEDITEPLLLTATGTAVNPIVFQKNGGGANPLVTRTDAGTLATSTLGGQGDAVIIIQGSDYITFDGISVATNEQGIEYGYYLRKNTVTDGCKYVTIKNAVIDLTKGTSAYVAGIYSSNNDPASIVSSATGITVASTGGRNENITITGNTVQDVFAGIVLRGYGAAAPYDFYDQNFVVGQSGQGNTIQNFAGNSTSTAYGVYLIYHNNANVSYNTINNTSGGGTGASSILYGIFNSIGVTSTFTASNNNINLTTSAASSALYGVNTASTGNLTMDNNVVQLNTTVTTSGILGYIYNSSAAASTLVSISNNVFVGTSLLTSTGALYLIYNNSSQLTPGVTNVSGNSISGSLNRTATTGITYCYYNNGSPTGTENFFNNVFDNITTSGSGALYGFLSTTASAATHNIYDNVISDFAGGTGIVYGIHRTLAAGSVYNNSVYNITGGGTVYGISCGSGNVSIYKNSIYNLSSTATSTTVGTVTGIYISGSTNTYIYNNFISDLKASTSASLDAVRGIGSTGTTASSNIGLYYNTIYLDAASSGTNFGSSGIYHTYSATATSAALDMRNNVIVNNSTPNGTGLTVAFRRSLATNLNNYSTNSNNNNFYAGSPGAANLIFYDGTNSDQTLTDFKTRVTPRESNSVSENSPFVDVSAPPYNLHIDPAAETQLESGGTPISSPIAVANDFDDDVRNVTTPDIGADEGTFTLKDLIPPAINYTALGNTSSTSNRTLTAAITDASGVPTTGTGLPVLYWKINAGSYSSAAGSYVSGNNYQFTFGAGVSVTDVVSYYIVAQDNEGNVGAAPSAGADGFSANPPAASTPPTSPNTYTIVGAVAGEILVGTGQTYTSLTANTSAGLFKAINEKIVTGNLTVKITSDLTETGAVALNQTLEEAIYTINIQPSAAEMRTISGSYAGGLIRLNGADGITFDGRFGGSGNYLTITNTATTGTIAAIQLSSLGTNAGAATNTIRNCNISTGFNGATSYGISVGGTTVGTAGDDNDNTSILNNVITKANYGIYARANATGVNNNLTITGNTIGSETSASYIGKYGIDVAQATGADISQNTIFNIIGSAFTNPFGIQIATGVVNSSINKNRIYSIKYTGASGYGGKGIDINTATATSSLTIANNVIYDITGDGWTTGSTDAIYGIRIQSSQGGINLYYNSVNMYGNISRSGATADQSYALYIGSSVTNLNIRNNVLVNSLDNTTGVATAYSIYSASANTAFTNINYNDYFVSGVEGVLGYLSSNRTTIADWRTATSQDANSFASDPLFRANDNLQPFTGSPVLAAGTPIAEITTDYSGTTRSETTPSIGAYETGYTPPGVDWANLQHPATGNINEGSSLTVYAQVYKDGVTPGAGQGANIQCWIGWSADNTNPNTWTNWTVATYNTDAGNNDEYKASIGGNLPAGTYHYASRFLLTDGIYQYGGYNSGFWDGTTNVSGGLTVNNATISWANLQFPATASIQEGGSADVYARVYVENVTNASEPSSGIQCWIGYSSTNNNPGTDGGWTWVDAAFYSHQGNNDEYKATIGSNLATGTYYYASRFKLVNDDYVYGGYSAGGGDFWNGTDYVSGELTVNPFTTAPPYIQNFDGVTAPALPAGWKVENSNSDANQWNNAASNPKSAPNAMKYIYHSTNAANDWFFTPGLNLTGGETYEVTFWYKGESGTYPEKLEIKYGASQNSAGMISEAIFSNTNINNTTYLKGTATLSPAENGTYYIGWHCFSAFDMYNLYVDDIEIRMQPTATNSSTISGGNTGTNTFGLTGTTIQFTVANTDPLDLTVDKIGSSPGGTLPSGLTNIAPQYWSVTVTSGTVTGTYSVTFDITGVPGVNNPATLHLLKRDNASGTWTDLGVPSSIDGNLLTWSGLTSFSEFGLGGDNENPLPVELSTFLAEVKGRDVILNWETATEINFNRFEVQRSKVHDDTETWENVASVKAHGNSYSPKKYNFADVKVNSGKYQYRLKMVDNDGTYTYSPVVEGEISIPKEYSLSQNYPNPFNPTTKIEYQLPFDSKVVLELYSITGERVATLTNEEQSAGYYTLELNASSLRLASGMYIYRMVGTSGVKPNTFVQVKKMVLIK